MNLRRIGKRLSALGERAFSQNLFVIIKERPVVNLRECSTLFNFGSLRDARVLEAVIGRPIACSNLKEGVLQGYRVVLVEGQVYPALVKDKTSTVAGTLFSNLTLEDLKRIEFYEEGLYRTKLYNIFSKADSKMVEALVYGVRRSDVKLLINEPWDFQTYREQVERGYLEEVKEFMLGYVNSERFTTSFGKTGKRYVYNEPYFAVGYPVLQGSRIPFNKTTFSQSMKLSKSRRRVYAIPL